MPSSIESQQLDALRSSNRTLESISNTLEHILKTLNEIDEHIENGEKIASESLETQREVLDQSKAQTIILQQISDDLAAEPPLTASVANVFSGEGTPMDNVLSFNVGQSSIDTLTPRLADGTTPSGGVISNVSVAFSDPSATAVLQPDNTILFTGVADSAGVAVGGSTSLTITDSDGVVSTWTVPFTVQTAGVVPPAQLTQSVANVFSTPTP